NGAIRKTTSIDDVKAAHDAELFVWVDVEKRTPETEKLLAETFGLHALTIDDLWSDRAVPKINEFDNYLYILVHGVAHGGGATDLRLMELDIVIGETFV